MRTDRRLAAAASTFLLAAALAPAPADEPADRPKLEMTPATICSSIEGYGVFTARDEPSLTRDEKLLIYFEPIGHAYETAGKEYRAHLSEDVRIRRKGRKDVLWRKEKFYDYMVRAKEPPIALYLSTTISLKPLPPGEYEADITLHDRIGKGEPAVQTVSFKVIPSPAAKKKGG